MQGSEINKMGGGTFRLTFVLVAFCLSPLTLFAQRLSLTPPAVTVMEGESGDFTVVLSSEPTANVMVTIVRANGTDIGLDKTVLIFTPSNWNVGQTVTLTAAEDEDITDDSGTLILIASGGGYDGDGVIVTPKTAMIDSLGGNIQLNAIAQDQDGSPVTSVIFDWSSADPSVAVVDSTGKVTAVNFGMTTITAALATISGTATILVEGDTPAPDRGILEILFKATGGEQWENRDGWLTDVPLNHWHGVTTNAEGHVTELSLVQNNLRGPIPPELGKLTQLRELKLTENSLSGPIPPEFGNLTQLKELVLFDNSLSGPIPPELGNLAQLEVLSLADNSLTGLIPPELGNLTQLEYLALAENNLSGPIPPELGNLTQLQELALDKNFLSGSIPLELGKLTRLKEFDLEHNSLSGPIPPELGNLTQLQQLNFGWNDLSGPIPPELGNLTQLEHLALAENNLSGPIPPELGNLTQLQELLLNKNFLSGSIPLELGKLTRLKEFDLEHSSLSGPIPPELGNLTQLQQLNFGWNDLSGPIPPELGNLTQLQELGLYENSLTGPIPPELGNLKQLAELALGINSLSGPIPPELGNLAQLEYLNLTRNDLTGPIPPELGGLAQLRTLWLFENSLTGPIPPELGNLRELERLLLNDNNDLEGLLPRSLMELNPRDFFITNTGICRQQDAVFLEWWNSLRDGRADDCTPEQVERLALMELYNKTNGASWTITSGWGSNTPFSDWHGVTVGNERVTELSLSNNSLSGPIPGEVANFTELSILNLTNNSLAGALPKEIAFLPDLTELRINGNTDLEGVLRGDLVNLENLEVLHFGGTSLCAPPTQRFQTWYSRIGNVIGTLCSNPAEIRLDIPVVYLTQSVQTQQNSVPLIEGRDALLRVFVTGDTGPAFFEHKVVATVRGGGRTHRVEMTRNGDRLAVAVNESDLANSFNAVIPGDVITPGATLVVEADPDGVIPRTAGSHDRFPVTGEEPLHVVSVPDMEVTVVPVLEADQPDESIFDWTNNISDDSPEVGLLKYAFPFHEFRARSRNEYITSLDLTSHDGQWKLVLELEALRLLDNETGYYYGAAASVSGFVRGRARLGGWTSMGKGWDTELAHEVGHNLNLKHAPCGEALDTDPDFPHTGGSVGTWGYDFRDNTLVSPRYHKDIMGYCYDRGWLSDYYFEKVIDYRERREGASGPSMAGAPGESDILVLWGGVQGGELRIESPLPASGRVQLPETDGPYRLEGLGENAVLFSLSFTPGEDKFGDKYFLFAIPIEEDWEESLERIVLTGPEGSVTIGADDQQRFTIVRDASTGRVRGFLRDWNGILPAAFGPAENLRIITTQSLSDAVRLQR